LAWIALAALPAMMLIYMWAEGYLIPVGVVVVVLGLWKGGTGGEVAAAVGAVAAISSAIFVATR
jgi:hypothetical protein